MKRLIQMSAMFMILVTMTGCAAPYMKNRMRDAADIFTFEVGLGAGANAKVGPIHAGAIVSLGNGFGLRGGEWGNGCGEPRTGEIELLFIPFPEGFADRPGKGLIFGGDINNLDGRTRERGKCYTAISEIPFLVTDFSDSGENINYAYFTQIEVAAGLLWVVHVGFNPGELLDFILGFTMIDIYSDDLELRQKPRQIRTGSISIEKMIMERDEEKRQIDIFRKEQMEKDRQKTNQVPGNIVN